MTHVLVTGAFGHVGGRVARHLADCGHSVRMGSRDTTRQRPAWLRDGELAATDFESAAGLEAACSDVDVVVHLAGAGDAASLADPEMALRVNGAYTLRLVRAAQRAGVRRLVYFSTAQVYGSPLIGTISEDTVPRPQHPYAITHRVGEDFVLSAGGAGVLQGIVLRLSNSFGAPVDMRVGWVPLVNDLCRQAIVSHRLTLRTPGLQYRDFVTLSAVVRAIEHLLDLPWSACGDGLFNLGAGESRRVIDMAEMVARRCQEVCGLTPPIERPAAVRDDSAPGLDYRIDRLKKTGFLPRNDLEGEVDALLKFCQTAFRRAS